MFKSNGIWEPRQAKTSRYKRNCDLRAKDGVVEEALGTGMGVWLHAKAGARESLTKMQNEGCSQAHG